jgi:hypothetical protein
MTLTRRSFILATIAITAPVKDAQAAFVTIGPAQRPRTDVEAWNFGIVPALDDVGRDADLRAAVRLHFGLLHLRGRYIEDGHNTEARGYFVIGYNNDSGLLKGHLKKFARLYDINTSHKPFYRDVVMYAPGGTVRDLGGFHLGRLGELYGVLVGLPGDVVWADIGLWTPVSFFNRVERRAVFEHA